MILQLLGAIVRIRKGIRVYIDSRVQNFALFIFALGIFEWVFHLTETVGTEGRQQWLVRALCGERSFGLSERG